MLNIVSYLSPPPLLFAVSRLNIEYLLFVLFGSVEGRLYYPIKFKSVCICTYIKYIAFAIISRFFYKKRQMY